MEPASEAIAQQRSLALLQPILDSSPHAIFVKDLKGRFIQCNQAFAQHLGRGREQILGHTSEDLFPGDTAAAFQAQDLQALVSPHGIDVEVNLPKGDGEGTYSIHKFPLRDPLGNIHAIFGFVTDITERRRVQAALESSEEKFRQLAENISEVFWMTNPEKTQLLYVSPAYESIWGRTCESLMRSPQDWLDAVYPADRQRVAEAAFSKQTQRAYDEIYRIVRPDGSIRWVRDRAFPLRDAKGEVYRLVGVAADITELKQIQLELSRREEQYHGVFSAVTEGLIIRSWDETIVEVNPAFCQMLGYSREELLRLKTEDYIAPDTLPLFKFYLETIRQGRPCRYEGCMRRKDGSLIAVEANGTMLQYDGRPHQLGVIRDITLRKQAEDAVRRSAAEFRIVFENAPIGVALVGADGHPIRCNRAVTELLGYSDEELQGMAFSQFTHPEDVAADVALYRELMEGKRERYQIEKRFVRKGGGVVSARLTVSMVLGPDGEAQYAIAMVEDVTERKLLEEQFLRAQRMEAIGALAAGIAHDLNNILAPMLLAAALLKSKLAEPRDQTMAGIIETGAQRGAAIIRQLLMFSRGAEGARINLQAGHLLSEMLHIVRETFPRNIQVELNAAADLWNVSADATQLHQVLINLCVNARDAMPGGGKLSLRAENIRLTEENSGVHPLARPGAYVVLTVADTGHGIPRDIVDRIFDPFFTTKPLGQGTGLGLSTVMGIVKSHGGFLTVASEPGEGTEFRVYLPAIDAPEPVRGPVIASAPGGHDELILLVDDEASIREATREVLERNRYRVVAAGNGEEGLQRFLEHREAVQLILTDMMMPVMGGLDLVRSIRILEPNVKIVATSGLDTPDWRSELAALGVREILPKPFEPAELLQTLQRALAGTAS